MSKTVNAMLDSLDQQHAQEEMREFSRQVRGVVRPLSLSLPAGGILPTSRKYLERFYAGDRLAREKKPGVFDHLRSNSIFFASIDDDPLVVVDSMSQTATVCGGFAEAPVVEAYVQGKFADTLSYAGDIVVPRHPQMKHAHAYASTLKEVVAGFAHVLFSNSGAEACETAFALALNARKNDKQRRLLAFEGSFHGRTLLALHASYNPKKRGPFELSGYEVSFAPYPALEGDDVPTQAQASTISDSLLKALAKKNVDTASLKELPQNEAAALMAVHDALRSGTYFGVIIEPMQSEGGDRYATARFYRCLRLLTRAHDIPLIFDEVQAGFGLGSAGFCWHTQFNLVDAAGKPDVPDAIVFAKRAQVGVVITNLDPIEPCSVHAASLVRGNLHAKWMTEDGHAHTVEKVARTRLRTIAEKYPVLVSNPRANGYAAAFDLPSTDVLTRFVAQRFWRGAVVFGAGSRTARYRFSKMFSEQDVERVFDAVDAALCWLEENPDTDPPTWHDTVDNEDKTTQKKNWNKEGIILRVPENVERDVILDAVIALEKDVYEEARRDPREKLAWAFDEPAGVVVIAEKLPTEKRQRRELIGVALGVPLERFSDLDGPKQDAMMGQRNTLYASALTVAEKQRGMGLGRALKRALLNEAKSLRNKEGRPRYRYVTGRNRVGVTGEMTAINRQLGAHQVALIENAYSDDPKSQAVYYRMPVGARSHPSENIDAEAVDAKTIPAEMVQAGSACEVFHRTPNELSKLESEGALFGPAVNKITICNYITPAIVRAVEWVSALVPSHPHLYLTSSRDECFEKTLRIFRYHRPRSHIAITFEGSYFGHTAAAARSLSDPHTHRGGPIYFDNFKRVPHPDNDVEQTLAALEAIVTEYGADNIIGLFVECIGERSGQVLRSDASAAIDKWKKKHAIPVAISETASAYYRANPQHAFYSPTLPLDSDAVFWWAGGQQGFVHVKEHIFVDKPLTFVSTWDGDELSIIRTHKQLQALRKRDLGPIHDALDSALSQSTRGLGAYRVLQGYNAPDNLCEMIANTIQIQLRPLPNGNIILSPPLDLDPDRITELAQTVVDLSKQ